MGRIQVDLWADEGDTLTVELEPSAALRLRAQLDEALRHWAADNAPPFRAELELRSVPTRNAH